MSRSLALASLCFSFACAGEGGDEEGGPDPVEEACFRIADGEIIDAGATPEEATPLSLGPDPYRVGIYPDQVSYISFESSGAPMVVMADALDVFATLRTDGVDVELPVATENPTCPEDIPSVLELDLPSGSHVLGIGPYYKATLWMVLAER